ncbi:MAG: DNA recombination protein RmuC [Bacteroidetes bacterium]|nr:DNA recombination protein RmuC [Bacteroidota bacterium]
MEFIFLAAGLLAGAAIAWFYARNRAITASKELEKEVEISREKLQIAESKLDDTETRIEEERNINSELNTKLAIAGERERSLQEKYDNYQQELDKLQQKFTLEFENIAGKILKQNTLDFSQANQKNITNILQPLRERIESFEKKVGETYVNGMKDREGLRTEIKKLHELNLKMGEEASNLTRALKADTKKQGNWGELVLEKVLERSGLIKGEEYTIQPSFRNEKNELIRPDVIINLPDDKHIIIDSKVSLIAYEAYVNADTDVDRAKFLKAHIDSLREHVRGLSDKDYQLARELDTPDFVLLFLPIESAFSIAIQEDNALFSFAWDRKIVIVSPTTLLATLKTVESIWKHEKQTRNAIEIARQSGNLHDKFVSFLQDMEKIGVQLRTTNKTYEGAYNKLTSGKGDLIGRIKNLQELGAKTSKEIPQKYLRTDAQEDDDTA